MTRSRSSTPREIRFSCTEMYHQRCACECRPCGFGYHCGGHEEGCHQGCHGPKPGYRGFRRFVCYRPAEPYRPNLGELEPGRPRFEGVVFSDGSCVIRWGPPSRSTSLFPSFPAVVRTHCHPEYGTIIAWLDDPEAGDDTGATSEVA